MKRIISYVILLSVLISNILPTVSNAQVTPDSLGYTILSTQQQSNELVTVKNYRIVDGDTADLVLNRVDEPSVKARFLLIDAPELGDNTYATAAKERVQELFQEANLIQIEYEGKRKDRYDRDLVHVWVDGILLQEILVTEGLAIARYIDGYINDSAHEDTIYKSQTHAKNRGLGVWDSDDTSYLSSAEYASSSPTTVENTSQTESVEPTQATSNPGEYVDENGNGLIKGSNNGIYHVPGSTYYNRTTNPAAWFKTVDEAVNSGYRAPKR